MIRLGFDLGGSHVAAGLIELPDQVRAVRSVKLPGQITFTELVARMGRMGRELLGERGCSSENPVEIGVAAPGEMDRATGVIRHAYNLDFHNVPLSRALEAEIPRATVFLINDADAAALAEWKAGVLKNYQTAWLLTLGTGVGGGFIEKGRLFFGGRGFGVEPGHMILDRQGPLCTCGNRGCIETLCSGTWLTQAAETAAIRYPHSRLAAEQKAGRPAGGKQVMECYEAGDAAATTIFERYTEQLGDALVSLIALTDPEAIALGGGVSQAGDFLYEALNGYVQKYAFFETAPPILRSRFGNSGGILGAAWATLEEEAEK